MDRQIIWSKFSSILLKEIIEYWNERNGSARYSEKLYDLFQTSLNQLAKYPKTGGLTQIDRVRYKKVRTYYLYYTFNDTALKVIALCHVKRSPEYINSLIE